MADDKTQRELKYLLLGEVLRPHGVRGELRMRILTDYPERITELEQVYLGRDPYSPHSESHVVEHMRMHKGYGLLKLKGIDDRSQAEYLRELKVMINLDSAVPLEDDEFYLYEVIGLAVRTQDGEDLGTVKSVMETGANDVYIVEGTAYGEVLIPVLEETIIETDIEGGVIIVRLPEGLIPNR